MTPAQVLAATQGYAKLAQNDALRTGNAVLDCILYAQRAEHARNLAMIHEANAEHVLEQARAARWVALIAAGVAIAVGLGVVLAVAYAALQLGTP